MAAGRKSVVEYEQVAELCNSMARAGEAPSVRKLLAQLGGDPKRVGEFLQRWRNESALAQSVKHTISESLQQALAAEFARVANAQRDKFQAVMEEANQKLTSTEIALEEKAQAMTVLEAELQQQLTKVNDQVLTLERQLSVAEERYTVAQQVSSEAQKTINELRERGHQSELRAVTAETKCDELRRQLVQLEKHQKK